MHWIQYGGAQLSILKKPFSSGSRRDRGLKLGQKRLVSASTSLFRPRPSDRCFGFILAQDRPVPAAFQRMLMRMGGHMRERQPWPSPASRRGTESPSRSPLGAVVRTVPPIAQEHRTGQALPDAGEKSRHRRAGCCWGWPAKQPTPH